MTLKYNKYTTPGVLEVNGDFSVLQKEVTDNCCIAVLVRKAINCLPFGPVREGLTGLCIAQIKPESG